MFWMLNYSEVCPQKWVFYQAVVVGIKDPVHISKMYFYFLECKIASRNCLIELLNSLG